MKKLLMAIFIPIIVILGTPALAATLMYDGSGAEHMPVHLYVQGADAQQMLFEELDSSIADLEDGIAEDMVFNLHQDIINTAIYETFKETNPDYAPGEDCSTPEQCYVIYEPFQIENFDISFKLVGAWVSFYDGASAVDPGRFVLNAYVEVGLEDGFSYKTVLEVHFLFKDDPDYYYLEFDKIQIGRLPIPKAMLASMINAADNNVDSIDLEQQVSEIEFGEFNLDNISYKINKDEILDAMSQGQEQNGEVDAGAKLSQEILSIIFSNQLLEFELVDEEFTLTAGVSQFRSDDDPEFPMYLYDLHDKEMVNGELVIGEFNAELFDPALEIQDMFTEYIFNSALLGGDFKISEKLFNKLIYSGAEGFTELRGTQEIEISETETKVIEFGLKAIWFEFEPTDIYVNALFKIGGIDSKLVIRAENISDNPDELIFEFMEITFGEDELEVDGDFIDIDDLAVFKEVFADLGDVEFGEFNENGDLVISVERLSALMQDGSEEGAVEVASIDMITNAIVLEIIPADPLYQAALDTFQDALSDVFEDSQLTNNLDDVLGITTGEATEEEQAVFDAVTNIQEAILLDPESVDPEDVDDLFENFTELDEETQVEFIETFGELIDPDTLGDFEDIFGAFTDPAPEEETPTE